jgi:hypothetical protein
MILYHFTCGQYLRGIARFGLTVGDVPTDINEGRVGIWLTSALTSGGHGLEGGRLNKKQYRLAVEVNDADPLLVKWTEWAPKHVTEGMLGALHSTASGSNTWWVYFGVLPSSSIRSCVDTATGADIPGWSEVSPVALDHPGVPGWRRHIWHRQLLKKAARGHSAIPLPQYRPRRRRPSGGVV